MIVYTSLFTRGVGWHVIDVDGGAILAGPFKGRGARERCLAEELRLRSAAVQRDRAADLPQYVCSDCVAGRLVPLGRRHELSRDGEHCCNDPGRDRQYAPVPSPAALGATGLWPDAVSIAVRCARAYRALKGRTSLLSRNEKIAVFDVLMRDAYELFKKHGVEP